MARYSPVGNISPVLPASALPDTPVLKDTTPSDRLLEDARARPAVSVSIGLSDAAKVLGHVFRLFPDAPSLTLNHGVPLFPAAPIQPNWHKTFAVVLQDSVSCSGLFYESHLAAWVAGSQPAWERLLRSPQARQGTLATVPDREDMASQSSDQSLTGTLMADGGKEVGSSSFANEEQENICRIVRQQLEVASTGQLAIRVQLWPEQWLHLDIQQEAEKKSAAEPQPEKTWTVRFETQIPPLGRISARLRLTGTDLNVQMMANDDTRSALMAYAEDLKEALSKAGLKVQIIFEH